MAESNSSWQFLPNALSCVRVALILPIGGALAFGQHGLACLLFVLAAVSDGLDGWVARRFHWTSKFGAALDPAADKLLMAAIFLTLTLLGHIHLWLAALVVLRDVIIVLGAMAYRRLIGPVDGAVTILGKLSTTIQLMYVCFVLAALWLSDEASLAAGAGGWAELASAVAAAVAPLSVALVVLTIVSGGQYVWVWAHRARAALEAR